MSLSAIDKNVSKARDRSLKSAFLLKYLPYWPLFFLLITSALSGAWLYLNFTAANYIATAKILIKDEAAGLQNVEVPELNSASLKKTTGIETQVVQSKTFLNGIVKKLNLNAPVFEEERLKNVSAYGSSPVVIVADSNNLKETGKVYFTVDKNSINLKKNIYPLNQWLNTPYGRLEFKKSQYQVKEQGKQYYFSLISPQKSAFSIASRLKFIPDQKAPGIVTVSFVDEVPLRGKDVVNESIKEYNKIIIDKRSMNAVNTAKLIDEQLEQVSNDLLSIENKLLYAKLSRKEAAIESRKRVFLGNIDANDREVGEINDKLKAFSQIEGLMQDNNRSALTVPLTIGLADPDLTQIVKKINHLNIQAANFKKTGAERNLSDVSYKNRIEKARFDLLKKLQNQRNSLQTRRNYLLRENNSYLSVLVSKLDKPEQSVNINKEQEIKKNQYVYLLKQKELIEIASVSHENGIEITEKVKSSSVHPDEKLIYTSAVFMALIFGSGVVIKKERFSNRVMSQEDIEHLTKLPIIGKITTEKSGIGLLMRNKTKMLNTTEFRKLRATLNYLIMDSSRKRILVTSAMAGEGKSFVALNLALSQALTGKKVVLISLDAGQPFSTTKINSDPADSEFTWQFSVTAGFEKMIRQTAIDDNLFLIAAEHLPESPSSLIQSGKAAELFDHLEGKFDCIIIDTATAGSGSDAYALSFLCDATLYVVRRGYTQKSKIEALDKEELRHALIVFNGIAA